MLDIARLLGHKKEIILVSLLSNGQVRMSYQEKYWIFPNQVEFILLDL